MNAKVFLVFSTNLYYGLCKNLLLLPLTSKSIGKIRYYRKKERLKNLLFGEENQEI